MDNNTENNIVITSRSQIARLFYKWREQFFFSGLNCRFVDGEIKENPIINDNDIAIIKEMEIYIEPIVNYIIDNNDYRVATELFKFQGWFEDFDVLGREFFKESGITASARKCLDNIYILFNWGFESRIADRNLERFISWEVSKSEFEHDEISEMLVLLFLNDLEKASEFVEEIKRERTDAGKARIAWRYCMNGYIPREDVNTRLYNELFNLGFVHCSISNWNNSLGPIYNK